VGRKSFWGDWQSVLSKTFFTYKPCATEGPGWFENGYWVDVGAHEVEILHWAPIYPPVDISDCGLTPVNAECAA
jgi:hypothetical protein